MPAHTWTLTDTQQGISIAQGELSPQDVAGSSGNWSVSKRTLRGGKQEGVEVVEVDNGEFRLVVIPTRGMKDDFCNTPSSSGRQKFTCTPENSFS